MEATKRHEGSHHTVNVKYGYMIFGLSLLYALIFALSHHVHLNRWLKQGAPGRKSVWARLAYPKPLWIHIIIWLALATGLVFFNIHNLQENNTIIIKRVGRLGFYLVPLDILLAIRPSLLATSYLEYIALHKWLLRLIILMVTIHGVGYFTKWLYAAEFWSKSVKILNLLGVIVFVLSLALILISIKPIRSRLYRAFYLLHNITICAFLVLTFWHARPGVTDAVLLSAFLIAFQFIQRIRNFYATTGITTVESDSTNLNIARLPMPIGYPREWLPGSHVRVTHKYTDVRSWLFPSHPYTICSLPGDSSLDLVLSKSHKFQIQHKIHYTLSSPFSSFPAPFFQTAESVFVICGGSGISLGIPIIRFFAKNSSVKSELHWAVSSKSDALILDYFNLQREIHVYVTEKSSRNPKVNEEFELADALLSSSEQYEMESLTSVENVPLENGEGTQKRANGNELADIKYHAGRPILDEIFSSLKDSTNNMNSWIVVCGPSALIRNVKAWGGEHNVQVLLETYAF